MSDARMTSARMTSVYGKRPANASAAPAVSYARFVAFPIPHSPFPHSGPIA